MPLRDDLLEPIAGDNPSGADLYYDPVLDRIKEARREEDDTLPAGSWERVAKKADHELAAELAGEALAKRSKDLRLAGPLTDSLFRLEGLRVLAPSIELLRTLQETFWPTLYPEMEGEDLELRGIEIERVAKQFALALPMTRVTKSGVTPARYEESRVVGYQAAADTDDRMKTRQAAIDAKKMTAEEFDKEFAATPKAFYVDAKTALDEAARQVELLDSYQRDAYGEQYPNIGMLRTAIQKIAVVFDALLAARRKTEPDAVVVAAVVEQAEEEAFVEDVPTDEPAATPVVRRAVVVPKGGDGYGQVVAGGLFLFEQDQRSPAPYLVCAGLRLGETRLQGSSPDTGFAAGPSSEVRQSLRSLALEGSWTDLLRAALPILGEPCARAWLDLHRYVWRAARESGADELAAAVCGTIRSLLEERPDVRHWTLEDDTAAANPETQAWLDAEVVRPTPDESAPRDVYMAPVLPPSTEEGEEDGAEDVYTAAMSLLQSGRAMEGISMMAREAEMQSSGRMKFRRRLQMAQMCLSAGHANVASAVLEDLAQEIDRRHLESWEAGELLGAPLALLLKCMDDRGDTSGARDALFARLCLLNPGAALSARR